MESLLPSREKILAAAKAGHRPHPGLEQWHRELMRQFEALRCLFCNKGFKKGAACAGYYYGPAGMEPWPGAIVGPFHDKCLLPWRVKMDIPADVVTVVDFLDED